MIRNYRLWINGQWCESNQKSDRLKTLRSPFDQQIVGEVHQASHDQLEEAIQASVTAFKKFRKSSRFLRHQLLRKMNLEIEKKKDQFIQMMIDEASKPHRMAEIEFQRALTTFQVASEEVRRFSGEIVPIDIDSSGRDYSAAVSLWEPRGPVLAIAPFNFPLNLVAHKVAPALAVGASILLKPSPQAPGCAHLLAEIFAAVSQEVSDDREEVPLSVLQVLNASNDVMESAVRDPRLPVLSFTGSDKVGWMLQSKAVRKKNLLELGGNAGVIVHKDASLARAAQRCAFGGYSYAGQSCISVQRIFVHNDIQTSFTDLLVKEISKLPSGSPKDIKTIIGPLIDSAAADRVESWIEEAIRQGAKVLVKGKRVGNLIEPTLLSQVPTSSPLHREEVFGPVVVLESYEEFADAIEQINKSRFGLQAGVFCQDVDLIRKACQKLEVGGVIINDVPTFRADNMPYGGVKDSGLGREGLRYAMEDYCERKTILSWQGEPRD